MTELRRPNLPQGRLKEFNDALHDLRLRAGQPSLRTIWKAMGKGSSHSRIHDVFSSERLPAWDFVVIVVETLCDQVSELSATAELPRLHALWVSACRNDDQPAASTRSQSEREAIAPHFIEVCETLLALGSLHDPVDRSLLIQFLQEELRDSRLEVPDAATQRLWTLALVDQIRWIPNGLKELVRVCDHLEGDSRGVRRLREISDLVYGSLNAPEIPPAEGKRPS
ncbi:effector-associated domain 2-containing protein [Streptomyces bobili]|uniref:effector-associated domain 2-containing protein n=1 Tax=Streptomyces bobili TaxID=67280 RepID=UPI003715EAB5